MKTIVASHNPDLAHDFDRDLLRRNDLRLVTARDTVDLVERLRAGADLCFIDRILPDGDALTALDTIRAEKRLEHVPVVLVSAASAPGLSRAEAQQHGFADVVELPAPPGALTLLVARLLRVPLRTDERFAVRMPVFDAASRDTSGDAYLGTSVDLSESGMLLKARREQPIGTTLGVRFTLPGRSTELSVRARVTRVDRQTFQPAVGLALAFKDPGHTEASTLHEYLRVLMSDRPFSWQFLHEDGQPMVALSGVLRGDSDLEALHGSLRGHVRLRLREFRRISSDSVQRWIDFIRSLSGVERISLYECPIPFIQQANLITNLLQGQEVVSLLAPYACESCGLDEEKLLDVARDLDGGRRRIPPTFDCSACGNPLAFDDLVEQYFAFLDR